MITRLQCPDPAQFEHDLQKATILAQDQGADIFLLAFAERSLETGLSWCPDCQVAYPVIIAALMQRKSSAVLLELTVEKFSSVYHTHTPLSLSNDSLAVIKIIAHIHIEDMKSYN